MAEKENKKGFFGNWIVKNLVAALIVAVVLLVGSMIFLNVVTKHNQELVVPDLSNMSVEEADSLAASEGMRIEVVDSVFVKRMRKGDTVIVTEISRLSRSLTDIMEVMGRCIDKGVHIYTTKEKYRFDDSINSKILCFAFGLVAEIERNLISLRTKEALALRKSEGKVLGRKKGYQPKMEVLRKNRENIMKMQLEGRRTGEICAKYKVSRDTYYKFMHSEPPHAIVHCC